MHGENLLGEILAVCGTLLFAIRGSQMARKWWLRRKHQDRLRNRQEKPGNPLNS